MQSQTFIFFGIIGSGKGTQAKLLMDFLKTKDDKECVYIGTGEIFRKIVESSLDNDSVKEVVKDLINAGKLIPDDITNKLVSDAVNSQSFLDKHLIFDGYPRTIAQSKFFEEMIDSYKIKDVKIIYIELSKEEAMKRNLLRGRHDDTETGLNKRFDEYFNKVVPSIDYFKDKNGYTIYKINGEQSVEDVHKEIINKIWKQ